MHREGERETGRGGVALALTLTGRREEGAGRRERERKISADLHEGVSKVFTAPVTELSAHRLQSRVGILILISTLTEKQIPPTPSPPHCTYMYKYI